MMTMTSPRNTSTEARRGACVVKNDVFASGDATAGELDAVTIVHLSTLYRSSLPPERTDQNASLFTTYGIFLTSPPKFRSRTSIRPCTHRPAIPLLGSDERRVILAALAKCGNRRHRSSIAGSRNGESAGKGS